MAANTTPSSFTEFGNWIANDWKTQTASPKPPSATGSTRLVRAMPDRVQSVQMTTHGSKQHEQP